MPFYTLSPVSDSFDDLVPTARSRIHSSTLSVMKHIDSRGPGTLPQRERARAQAFFSDVMDPRDLDSRNKPSAPVTNGGVYYIADVAIGNPPTLYSLQVDTGSATTWVGADPDKPYKRSDASHKTGQALQVAYSALGGALFEGTEYLDTVTLGQDLVITGQSIGAALSTQGIRGYDGILGVGPVGLTRGTFKFDVLKTVSTVTNNLYNQGKTQANLLAVSFRPTTTLRNPNGEISFGQVNSQKHTGCIDYHPMSTVWPASKYFGIDQSITYGESNIPILSISSGIMDTGASLILLETDAFEAYKQATGATIDKETEFLTVTREEFHRMQSLYFKIGHKTYEFTRNAQIWPRALNTALKGGNANKIYLIIGNLGRSSGQGAFINGMSFLERFYSVYDMEHKCIGLADTPWTHEEIN